VVDDDVGDLATGVRKQSARWLWGFVRG